MTEITTEKTSDIQDIIDRRIPPRRKSHKGALIVGAVLAGVGGITYSIVNANWGYPGKLLNKGEVEAAASSKYAKAFHADSPVGKFALQFMGTEQITVDNWTGASGLQGDGHTTTSTVTFNNTCLANTAFQIRQGNLKGTWSGLFSGGSLSGESVAATAYAEVDPNNPNILMVISRQTGSTTLKLSGLHEGSALVAADPATEGILEAYGCETGITKVVNNTPVNNN